MGLSEILLNNLLDAREFKAQMVIPSNTVSVTVLVTQLVTPVPVDISVFLCFGLFP